MESSLAVQLKDLKAKVGNFLGYGYGADMGDTAWSDRQILAIKDAVDSGVSQVYTPPIPYEWTFLKPPLTLLLQTGHNTVNLPDDFGGIEGQVTLSTSSAGSYRPVAVLNAGLVAEKYAVSPSATGCPQCVSVRPIKGSTQQSGSRFELYVFPTSDAMYTLSFTCYLIADALSADRPYPLGGAEMRELYIESCLAIAEQRLDDQAGVHTQKFMQSLIAAIAADRRKKPIKGGYNHDRSDLMDEPGRHPEVTVTYNGVAY